MTDTEYVAHVWKLNADRNRTLLIDKMVTLLVSLLSDVPDQLAKFEKAKEFELVLYNNSYGRFIRNEFRLWEQEWVPEVVDGIDQSAGHPDNISYEVLVKAWKILNSKKK